MSSVRHGSLPNLLVYLTILSLTDIFSEAKPEKGTSEEFPDSKPSILDVREL